MSTEMTVDKWLETYKPIVNHLDDNASWQDDDGNGIMFETYGEELLFVEQCQENRQVWSYHDDEYEGTIITQGMAWTAPIGYFVTEVPWKTSDNIIVRVIGEDV